MSRLFFADAHRGDGKRFFVRADEKLTAFMELERAIRARPSCAKELAQPDSSVSGDVLHRNNWTLYQALLLEAKLFASTPPEFQCSPSFFRNFGPEFPKKNDERKIST
jgi:hypothetical protein